MQFTRSRTSAQILIILPIYCPQFKLGSYTIFVFFESINRENSLPQVLSNVRNRLQALQFPAVSPKRMDW